MQKDTEKTESILEAAREEINMLQLTKKTGTFNVSLELNMSQGCIADAYIHKNTREKIKS